MRRIWLWNVRELRHAASVAIGLSLTGPAAAVACPLCKDAIANDPVAAAFNSTTEFMIAVPFLLIGSIGGWIFYRYWRSARDANAPERAPVTWGPVWREKESET